MVQHSSSYFDHVIIYGWFKTIESPDISRTCQKAKITWFCQVESKLTKRRKPWVNTEGLGPIRVQNMN